MSREPKLVRDIKHSVPPQSTIANVAPATQIWEDILKKLPFTDVALSGHQCSVTHPMWSLVPRHLPTSFSSRPLLPGLGHLLRISGAERVDADFQGLYSFIRSC